MRASELADWLQLWHVPGIGPKIFMQLLHHFDNNPGAVLATHPSDLTNIGLPNALALRIKRATSKATEADFNWLATNSAHHILTLDDSAYPRHLRHIATPPPILYVKGNPDLFNHFPCLAIVGSRKATGLGKQNAFQLANKLAELGIAIASGLAAGIDGQAHRGALASQTAATIAVLANGLNKLYPPQHRALSEEIAAHGVLVSEFSPFTPPLPQHFPRRNRIISGLSFGTVVVEARVRSGSLITARYALEQNREVFAVPGPINSPYSEGCHRLIQEGAKLVTAIEDILLECPQIHGQLCSDRTNTKLQDVQSDTVKQLLSIIEYVPMSMDMLIEKSGLTPDQVSSMLIELEMSGHVVCDPNDLYSRSALE